MCMDIYVCICVYIVYMCMDIYCIYVYGYICVYMCVWIYIDMDIGKDWRPNMSIEGVLVSILSLLGSNTKISVPIDDTYHTMSNSPGLSQDNWIYHDNIVS